MDLFLSTMSQMAYLFSFIALGFVLTKIGALPKESAKVISKLENNLLLPAMVLNTFTQRFTVKTLSDAGLTLLYSLGVLLVAIFVSLVLVRFLTGDGYLRKIYTYGLCFSNFGFMGYAVVNALFPAIYFEYVLFTLPLWTGIYVWGTPELLIADANKKGIKHRLKNFVNPMFICMIVGMIFGLTGTMGSMDAAGETFVAHGAVKWFMDVIAAAEKCMSPLAMLLTGITLAFIDLKKTFTTVSIYVVSLIRLLVFPGIFLAIGTLCGLEGTRFLCALCTLAMPLGLSTIVVPAAYGRDTSQAAGMALISHALSCITIPIIFSFVQL
ncbi:MAG: hypothetical protein E7580_01130 [Ruminococcaceae bacterium]|nr:hypothetical protein [Oscillospiraceae bacterium]